MSRKMTVTVEVSQGDGFSDAWKRGMGEAVSRSSYEVSLEAYIRADVTFDDIDLAVSRFRAFELTKEEAA